MTPKPFRAWINAPSTHQRHHALHGTRVLAVFEYASTYTETYTIYFLAGPVVSMQVFGSDLSKGWPDE